MDAIALVGALRGSSKRAPAAITVSAKESPKAVKDKNLLRTTLGALSGAPTDAGRLRRGTDRTDRMRSDRKNLRRLHTKDGIAIWYAI